MSDILDDPQLEERLDSLNGIITRRNAFLKELYSMMHTQEGFLHLTDMDDEDTVLHEFIDKYDLQKNLVDASISNLDEDEFFNAIHQTSLHQPEPKPLSSASSSHTDVRPTSTTRTTRSRSRAAELVHLLPLPPSIAEGLLSEEHTPPAKIEGKASVVSSPVAKHESPEPSTDIPSKEEEDDDIDELDLIGSSSPVSQTEQQPIENPTLPSSSHDRSLTPIAASNGAEETSDLDSSLIISQTPSMETNRDVQVLETRITKEEEDEDVDMSATNEVLDAATEGAEKDSSMDVDDESRTTERDSAPITIVGDATRPVVVSTSAADEPAVVVEDQEANNTVGTINPVEISAPEPPPPPPPKVPYVPIRITYPPSIHKAIQIPHTSPIEQPNYTFESILENKPPQPAPEESSAKKTTFDFPLPPLSLLPPEFTRKAKSSKRKRNPEKEIKKEKDKDELPLGIHRWNASILANPVWRRVARSTKCLSTKEWSIAMSELKLVRTLERVERLKEEGRWSFRQPKKQRGVGGLTKTHWDYLMDEMKWMRVDFREERRWKLVVAYNLAHAALDWHSLSTPEERFEAGVCVRWKPVVPKERLPSEAMDVESSEQETVQSQRQPQQNTSFLGVDYGSDADEDDMETDEQQVVESLEPSNAVTEAFAASDELKLKSEDVDDPSPLDLHSVVNGTDSPMNAMSTSEGDALASSTSLEGLKRSSINPILGDSFTKSSSQSANEDGDSQSAFPKISKQQLAPIREKIVYSDVSQVFLTMEDIAELLTEDLESIDFSNLNILFPELTPLAMLDVAPPAPPPVDGKKKTEKRSDRDDPNKRIEDTTYTKLYPIGRFMHEKPTLLGPLQPAKRWKDDHWLPAPEILWTQENDGARASPEEVGASNDLFEGRPSNTTNFGFQIQTSSFKDKDNRKRGACDIVWNANDDALLKSLVDRFSNNWALIAECYNSSRLTTPSDKRSPTECAERWKERWGQERKIPLPGLPDVPTSSQTPVDETSASALASGSQMTTRGVKRLASSSVSSNAPPVAASGSEPKKRRRHLVLQEGIRRLARRRQEVAAKMATQRKSTGIHETHNQYNKLPKLTPAELGRMKADRDQQATNDLVMARRRNEEIQRLRDQAARGGPVPVAQQPSQQAPQSTPQTQQAPAPVAQPQAVPQQPAPSLPQTSPPVPPSHQQTPPQVNPAQQAQLAQLQHLQAQAQAAQARVNAAGGSVPMASRPPRMANTPNRNIPQQMLLQQARLQLGPQGLGQIGLLQAQGANGAVNGSFYGLPSNLTQEQILMLALTAQQQAAAQQAQQQQQGHQQASQGPNTTNGNANGFMPQT